MGIAGTVGFFKRYKCHFNRTMALKDTKIVIDITKGFYWAVKEQLIDRHSSSGYQMNRYGTSMIELGTFYRNLLRRLRDRNCTPILVYEGCTLSEPGYGPLASKAKFMRSSCEGALRRLEQGQVHKLGDLPELVNNCIKEIVNEYNFNDNQLYQATSEVYPLLEQLARQHDCPVMTSHSDFIFSDVPRGFIWLEETEIPVDARSSWYCTMYFHDAMLRHFQLDERHSPAINCLRVLLRDDFRNTYPGPVNSTLKLGGPIKGEKTKQLCQLMERWPRHLDSVDSVLGSLKSYSAYNTKLIADFAAIHQSFTKAQEFASSDLMRTLADGQDRIGNLQDALLRRESSIDFIAHLRNKSVEYRRTNFQDIQTFRSTYSMSDRVKQYLAERFCVTEARLFDREHNCMLERSLSGPNQVTGLLQVPLNGDLLFTLFHFSERARQALADRLTSTLQVDSENANRLALMLLLARFSLKLVPRETYDNTDYQMAGSSRRRSNSSSSTIKPLLSAHRPSTPPIPALEGLIAQRYHNLDMRRKYFTAILNSFVYHSGRQHQGDQSSREVPADIRFARQKIESIAMKPPGVYASATNPIYVTCKHLVEALNSTLHSYKELNSLYNFPGPNIIVNKFYDGVLIYKLMSSMSKNLAGSLLQLDNELERDLFDF